MGFNGFYWVLPSFTGFYWVLLGFFLDSLSFTEFYWVLLGFTGFYWVLPGFTGFYWVLPGFTGFNWVLLGFTGFYWVLAGLNGLYLVLLGIIGWWVLFCFSSRMMQVVWSGILTMGPPLLSQRKGGPCLLSVAEINLRREQFRTPERNEKTRSFRVVWISWSRNDRFLSILLFESIESQRENIAWLSLFQRRTFLWIVSLNDFYFRRNQFGFGGIIFRFFQIVKWRAVDFKTGNYFYWKYLWRYQEMKKTKNII